MIDYDYTYCWSYNKNKCPASCFRAEITAELEATAQRLRWLSWADFSKTDECERGKDELQKVDN